MDKPSVLSHDALVKIASECILDGNEYLLDWREHGEEAHQEAIRFMTGYTSSTIRSRGYILLNDGMAPNNAVEKAVSEAFDFLLRRVVLAARQQLGPGNEAHERLKAMGAISNADAERWQEQQQAFRDVLAKFGHLFPEGM